METRRSFGSRMRLIWFFMGICLFLPYSKAEYNLQPLKHLHQSPFWQWRSAYECLLNVSDRCSNKDLTLSGDLEVNQTEVEQYCSGGCAEHTTKYVLKCIHWAKRDFWFANKATIRDLNETITKNCANNTAFSIADFTSNAMKTYQNSFKSLVASLATVLAIAILKI